MQLKTTAIAIALLGLYLGLPASAADKPMPATHVSTSPMMEFENSGRVPGAGAYSTLRRTSRWVEVQISTNGVDPSTPYTVWAVIDGAAVHRRHRRGAVNAEESAVEDIAG